jgi:hypothetical protein
MRGIIIAAVIIATCAAICGAYDSLTITMDIPMNKDMASDVLVAGQSWERAKITIENTGDSTLNNVMVTIELPEYVDINIPHQPVDVKQTNQTMIVIAMVGELTPHGTASVLLDVRPPGSIEFKKEVAFTITATHNAGETIITHPITIIPPPSWITYLTIFASLLLFIGIIATVKRLGVLEMFTTVDLITIALIAALIAVVFRYLSKMVNLGWFDGLVISIPTVALMIVALQLVRKPGTATLLFTIVLLISVVMWGSHIMWLGFYMAEGLVVDFLVFLFKFDYADRRSTAVIYGVARSVTATLIFYLLFAPVEWKISYAAWYIWMHAGIACSGGIIGGIIGYDTAVKMGGARL